MTDVAIFGIVCSISFDSYGFFFSVILVVGVRCQPTSKQHFRLSVECGFGF